MSGWQLSGDAPTTYTRFAIHLMEPWTDDLIQHGRCKTGDRVLDVACGTGFVAKRVNLATDAQCKITGIDVNEPMLNAARQEREIEWQLGSATAMPFSDGSFDVVLCQQGLQYFPDRLAAMKEMARVLTPGGRLSLNVWGSLERQPFIVALVDAMGKFLGREARKSLDLAYSLNTAAELHKLAKDAGLKEVEVRFEHRTIRYPDTAELAKGFIQATPAASLFAALPDEEKTEFGAHVAAGLKDYVDDAGMAVPQENHFLYAVR